MLHIELVAEPGENIVHSDLQRTDPFREGDSSEPIPFVSVYHVRGSSRIARRPVSPDPQVPRPIELKSIEIGQELGNRDFLPALPGEVTVLLVVRVVELLLKGSRHERRSHGHWLQR